MRLEIVLAVACYIVIFVLIPNSIVWLEDVQVGRPMHPDRDSQSRNRFIMPAECRERGISYKGKISGRLMFSIHRSGEVHPETKSEAKSLGQLPIMIKSARCNLKDLSPAQLVKRKEDAEELGGYFIVNGIEKLVRLLIVARRNHPLALIRSSFAKRGPTYSQYGIQIRCVRDDQSSQSLFLHYLTDGSCMVRFSYRKNEYLIPLVLILKALVDTNDMEIMEGILQGDHEDTFVSGRVEMMLREFKKHCLFTRTQCLEYLGSRFAVVLGLPQDTPHAQVGEAFLKKIVLVHLESSLDKFNLFILMVRKLFALVSGQCSVDNPDSAVQQEILLTGHLYLQYLKEKLDDFLNSIKTAVSIDIRKSPQNVNLGSEAYFKRVLGKVNSDIGRKMEYFLATGNLVSNTGLDLQQTTGYTVVAEKLNFLRFLAHFRSVHRGAFFAELKTTTVRKLMPESWGFFCPVHTPDGAPCGLLNHLAHVCRVAITPVDSNSLAAVLFSLGVQPIERRAQRMLNSFPVVVDGKWIGLLPPNQIVKVAEILRHMKATKTSADLPEYLEVVSVPVSNGGLYPGLYLYSGPARMMRPVRYITDEKCKDETSFPQTYVGTFEQIYLDIAVKPEEIVPGLSRYVEIAPTNMLSVVANLIPFPDFNQSPRNMYQCQMAKQSIGTPVHAYPFRTDNKLYRLMTGQTPIVRPRLLHPYGIDGYPNGTNAIVCVISYTGYDMEDAMILNKSSFERGFAHAVVYKSEFYDISDRQVRGEPRSHYFGVKDERAVGKTLEVDGLPAVGQLIKPDDPLFSVIDHTTGNVRVERYKAFEEAYVEEVRLIGDDHGQTPLSKVHIKFRIPRNPIIGDKFASRAGQKGICSQKWPLIDMPFTESGMTPDIIINPHAFPSRMTIGMLLESMAGKAGALHGLAQDATPFNFNEHSSPSAYFGEQLLKAGYNYYGNEPMYSGIDGAEMRADIYIGCVYYQRLRHMVSDKFQVRTTGPVHNLTHQPVKGRKRAGGIRFGEMERDSLLAHGVSFLLQDRLMNCSDYSQSYVCTACGSILSPIATPTSYLDPSSRSVHCQICKSSDHIDVIAIPYVFRYLSAELMAMNVGMKLQF